MNMLSEDVAHGVNWLIQASLELDTWIHNVLKEEELLAWHIGELLYDLRGTEMRLAEMVSFREPAAAIDALDEHCADVLDYLVPHWPLHVGPLRDRVVVRCKSITSIDGSKGFPELLGDLASYRDSESVALKGIDSLLAASREFAMWMEMVGMGGAVFAQKLNDFLLDLKTLHRHLFRALPSRKLDEIGPAVLIFCDDVDTMLIRWRADMTCLRCWLNEHAPRAEVDLADGQEKNEE
jgi:hypothetical protein